MLDSKAYTEVNYIINEMSEDMRKKIPNDLINFFEKNKDNNYHFQIQNDDFEAVKLLIDTEKILSVLYEDYIATEEERKIIKAKERALSKEKHKLPDIKIKKDLFSGRKKGLK